MGDARGDGRIPYEWLPCHAVSNDVCARCIIPEACCCEMPSFDRPVCVSQFGMGKAKGVARKQRKEKKNRAKKVRGAKKTAVLGKKV